MSFNVFHIYFRQTKELRAKHNGDKEGFFKEWLLLNNSFYRKGSILKTNITILELNQNKKFLLLKTEHSGTKAKFVHTQVSAKTQYRSFLQCSTNRAGSVYCFCFFSIYRAFAHRFFSLSFALSRQIYCAFAKCRYMFVFSFDSFK